MNKPLVMLGAMAASAMFSLSVAADVEWKYTILDATAKTVSLTGAETDGDTIDAAALPGKLTIAGEEYTVTSIAQDAFSNNKKLKGVLAIPDSVTAVEGEAFQGCTGLTGISTLGGTETLSWYVFNNDNNLSGKLPDLSKVTRFGNGVFQFCNGLTGEAKFNSALGEIPNRVFYFNWKAAGGITKMDIPRSVLRIGNKAFQNGATGISGLWVKGPFTVASGTQKYTTVSAEDNFNGYRNKLKIAFFGPNTKVTNLEKQSSFFSYTTGCKILVPANGYWGELTTGGTSPDIIYYGADEGFDLDDGDEEAMVLTATPKTEAGLVKVLSLAPLFKEHLGLNIHVNIENTIEITEGNITADMLNAVKFNTMLLTFKVNTQAVLEKVLSAVPEANWPCLAIDTRDAKETLTLPQNRKVWVCISGEGNQGKYVPKINGTVISLK